MTLNRNNQHYIAKFHIDDEWFEYDDLKELGSELKSKDTIPEGFNISYLFYGKHHVFYPYSLNYRC